MDAHTINNTGTGQHGFAQHGFTGRSMTYDCEVSDFSSLIFFHKIQYNRPIIKKSQRSRWLNCKERTGVRKRIRQESCYKLCMGANREKSKDSREVDLKLAILMRFEPIHTHADLDLNGHIQGDSRFHFFFHQQTEDSLFGFEQVEYQFVMHLQQHTAFQPLLL